MSSNPDLRAFLPSQERPCGALVADGVADIVAADGAVDGVAIAAAGEVQSVSAGLALYFFCSSRATAHLRASPAASNRSKPSGNCADEWSESTEEARAAARADDAQ